MESVEALRAFRLLPCSEDDLKTRFLALAEGIRFCHELFCGLERALSEEENTLETVSSELLTHSEVSEEAEWPLSELREATQDLRMALSVLYDYLEEAEPSCYDEAVEHTLKACERLNRAEEALRELDQEFQALG